MRLLYTVFLFKKAEKRKLNEKSKMDKKTARKKN